MDTILHPADFAVTNVVAILPDRIVDGATVVVRDGVVDSIAERGAAPPASIDGRGAFCAPGLVDTHSDGLEKELRPRPGVVLPMEFALRSFEGRVRGAGVTTIHHGIGYENGSKYDRSVEQAMEMNAVLERRAGSGEALIDHRVLHRLDVRDEDGFEALRTAITGSAPSPGQPAPLVSYEDHTPGQGQYRDRRWMERYIAGTKGLAVDEAERYIDGLIAERDARLGQRDRALPWLADLAQRGRIRLMCHDPTTPDDIDEAIELGATIAEFPTTVAAASAARERGLRIVCGAPNALRGESHSGNVSARELIALGLCDTLASDYLPSTLLGAVAALVDGQVCQLPDAVRLVTGGAADTAGFGDRGRLEPGRRGDMVLFDLRRTLPTVRLAATQTSSMLAVRDTRLVRSHA